MAEGKTRPNLLKYASAGMEFFLTFALPATAGLLLDRRLGTTPGYTLLGAALGFVAGLRRLLIQAREIRRAGEDQTEDQTHDGP